MSIPSVMLKNARQVVAFYKRRCWWTDVEDMHQEALVTQLAAARGFDLRRASTAVDATAENTLERYLYLAATYGVRRLVLKASAPVSASHRLDVLKGLYRAPLDTFDAETAAIADNAVYARQVLDRVVRCLGEDRAAFYLAILFDELNAQDVAEANGVTREDVLRELMYSRGKLRADPDLHKMWQEGPP